jgi:hypothetical protein
MAVSRLLLAAVCGTAVALAVPGVATAATTYSDSVIGFEYSATSTQGKFSGTAYGALAGAWAATVVHDPLGTTGAVTGGYMNLVTAVNGTPTLVEGHVYGGAIVQTSGFGGCVNQSYRVDLTLNRVRANGRGDEGGLYGGTLTHYRRSVFGRCLIYSATINGSMTLTI